MTVTSVYSGGQVISQHLKLGGESTPTAITSVFLALVLTFFTAGVSEADVWVCSQANGSVLYTNEPQEAGCQKFEPVSQLIYLPSRVSENAPHPESTYEKQETDEPDVQMTSTGEEQTVVPPYAGESYEPQQNGFWSWNDNPVFISVYTYVPEFYRGPPSRHRYLREFEGRPRTKHETPYRSQPTLRSLMQSVPSTPAEPRHFRETSTRRSAPALPQSVSPNPSRQVQEASVQTIAPLAPSKTPALNQPINRSPRLN